MAELTINNVVMTILAVTIGVILVGSLMAPIASDVMSKLTDMGSDGAAWASLVGVVVIISILGLIIIAVNSYTRKN